MSHYTLPSSSKKHKMKSFTFQYAKPVRENSVLWHKIRIVCNGPIKGIVHNIMKESRMEYHKIVKA